MKTLYKLTDREADILSNLDQSDVVATGPWRKGYGCMPHRAVIRDLGDKMVVHNQIIGDTRAYYANGIYIHKEQSLILEHAWTEFDLRVRKLHHWPNQE